MKGEENMHCGSSCNWIYASLKIKGTESHEELNRENKNFRVVWAKAAQKGKSMRMKKKRIP
jgi:hypothetical protein